MQFFVKEFSAIQTVEEGNLGKDGQMAGGVFGGVERLYGARSLLFKNLDNVFLL